MNPFRAKKIADHFSSIASFTMTNKMYGVYVTFHGNLAYFENETSLWAFLFHIAHAEHQESIIAEAKSQLAA